MGKSKMTAGGGRASIDPSLQNVELMLQVMTAKAERTKRMLDEKEMALNDSLEEHKARE